MKGDGQSLPLSEVEGSVRRTRALLSQKVLFAGVSSRFETELGTSGPARSFRADMTSLHLTFSQAPQAVRSARGRRWDRAFPSTACAGRTFHPNKCNAFGPTADIHRLGNIHGTAAARAILRSHLSPSVAIEFFTKSASLRQKVICVTKHEQCCRNSALRFPALSI